LLEKRDQIIGDLFISKDFNDLIGRIEPAHLRDDLKQEAICILLELPYERVEQLHSNGELSFYLVRCVFNMVTNKYHPFFKKFRDVNIEYKEMLSESWFEAIDNSEDFYKPDGFAKRHDCDESEAFRDNERNQKEELEDYTLEQIESLYWYDRDLIKIYLQIGTYRGIQGLTGIPYQSCYKNIQKSLEILRQKALAPKPIFTKEELNFIQNGDKKDS